MDKIKDLISNILTGNNVAAKESFDKLVFEMALDRLEEKKQEIAENLFQTEEFSEEADALFENYEIINEVSLGAKLRAYARHTTAAFENDDEGNDDEAEQHQQKADKILNHIAKKHGPEAVENANRMADSKIFGRSNRKGSDSLSGGLRGNLSQNLTKSGKVPKNTQSAMKNAGRKIGGPKGNLPEESYSLAEGPIGAALGGGLGAMAGGPLGAALGGALGHAAGEMAPKALKKVGRVAKKVAGIGGGAVVGGALGGPLGALGGGYLGHRMTKEEAEELEEKAVSQQQQKFMGMVYAAKKGEMPASPEVAKAAKGITKQQAKDYAATKHAGLPKKIEQEGWFGGDDKPTPPPKPEPKQPSTPPPSGSSSPSVGGAVGAIKSRQKMLDDI